MRIIDMRKNPVSLTSAIVWAGAGWLFWLAVAPFPPGIMINQLDSSWAHGLEALTARHMQYGQDVVFTYGPYANLATKQFNSVTWPTAMVVCSVMALTWLWLYHVMTRNSRPLRSALCLLFFSLTALVVRDPVFFLMPLIFVLALVEAERSNFRGLGDRGVLCLAAAFLALHGLMKFSFLPVAGTALLVAIFFLLQRRRWHLAMGMAAISLGSFFLFWTLAGQLPVGVVGYFANSMKIVASYSDGMIIDGRNREVWAYLAASAAFVAYAMWHYRQQKALALAVSAVLCVVLFMSMKAAFVRHDTWHAYSAQVVLWMAFFVLFVNAGRKTLVAGFVLTLALTSLIFPGNPVKTMRLLPAVHENLWRPWKYVEVVRSIPAVEERLRLDILNIFPLPAVDGTMDIYGYEQARVLAVDANRWSPHPIFQSYTALSPELQQMNADHLLGDKAADHIFYKFQTIDGRFPTLDDGLTLPVLARNYQFEGAYQDVLHFTRRPGRPQAFEPVSLGRKNYRLGEAIEVPETSDPVFVRIHLKKTLKGRIMTTLFKSSVMHMTVTTADGADRRYRVVKGMTETGFILSPVISDNEDFVRLLSGPLEVDDGKRVRRILISPQRHKSYWENEFELEFCTFSIVERSPEPGALTR